VLGQFAMLALVWGASFLFIKVGLEGLSPTQVVLGRLLSGSAALVVVSLISRQRPPRDPVVWMHLVVVSILLCVVLAPWRGLTSGDVLNQVACLAATLSYGAAFVYLRRFVSPRGLGAIPVATVQVGLGAVIMLLLAPFTAATQIHLSWQVVASISALGVMGTGIAYVWNTNIVANWGATNASTVTYLTPVVGVLLGIVVLGEPLSWNEPLGALIVVAGIAISQGRLRTPFRRATSVDPALADAAGQPGMHPGS